MTISYALETSLRNEMFSGNGATLYDIITTLPSYQNNTAFSGFLEVVLPCNGECFIPVLCLQDTIRYIQHWFGLTHPMQSVKLSYPLYAGRRGTKRTADSIIRSINRCPSNLRLTNIKTSKGLGYYGGNGIIFDEHWTPLMLCGFIINIDRTDRCITVVKPVCYVSPIVFEKNDILSKAIVKKVIPYLSMNGIAAPHVFESFNCLSFNYDILRNVPITIKFLNDYFTFPAHPDVIESLDDSIWDFLQENVNDLV